MVEPRAQQPADNSQPNVFAGRATPGRGAGPDFSPHRGEAPSWELGGSGAGRPRTPAVDGAAHGWRNAPAPPSLGARQQQQQQQRAATPSSHATPRVATGLLRAVRTSSNSLTGLLRRPATALAGGSPGGVSPLFEVRGAGLAPPELPRPATTSHAAAQPQRSSPFAHLVQQQQKYHPAAALPPTFNIQARASQRTATAPPASSPHLSAQWQTAVVAAHGLDLGASPAAAGSSPAVSLAHQLEAVAAPSPTAEATKQQHRQQQQEQQDAASSPPTTTQASAVSSRYGRSSSGGTGGRATPPPGTAPPGFSTNVHSNPLYSSGSEAYPRPRKQQQQQGAQQQQQRAPPPVRLAATTAATSLPHTPLAGGTSQPLAGHTPGVSPLAGTLHAASNLTMANDSRPISPGPFLSTLASGALPDSGSRSSRPVSPQGMDSSPPTPGSFAQLGAAAAAAARGASNLSPVKTTAAAAAQQHSRSLPSSPAVAPAPSTTGVAATAATAFRLPIFNRDGRLVGYKQNSNLLSRPGACISSAPSSPIRSGLSTTETLTHGGTSASTDGASPTYAQAGAAAAAALTPAPGDSSDFAEPLADPFRGFQDADNMVQGYVLGPVLGKGGFCSVRKALHELTGQVVACKIIEKGKLKDPKDRDRVDRECRVMRNLSNHVAVVKLFEYVETKDFVYIMMEAAKRGSLLDYVRERKKLPEEEAVTIFQQLLHSLQFCHRKDVVHRDIKLENILINSAGHMKLIDFGLCGYYVNGKRLRCHCGSPSYAAPEIVARKDYLGPPVDVWSLGIVLFAMLAGYLPFHAKEKKQLSEKILSGVYKPAAWMSPEAQDLLSRMLTLDPDQRITLEEAWAHPWVARAPRWEPPGVGAGRLYRALTDPSTGAVLPDDAVLLQLEALGADVANIRRALRSRECNSLTASYHLVFESQLEVQRSSAAASRDASTKRVTNERAAAAAAAAMATAAKKAPAPSTAGDWQWDFASINAAAAAAAAAAGGSGGADAGSSSAIGSSASAGSSSLRASSSPTRPRTAGAPAVVPAASPTRFGQEAAAAGYLSSPRRHAAAVATAVAGYSWEVQQGSSAVQQAATAARHVAASTVVTVTAGPEWDIKAVRQSTADSAGTVAAEPDMPTGPPAPLILTTTTTTMADCTSPTAGHKSCCLPTMLSPKQLHLVAGSGSGSAGSGDRSPPIAQAV